MTNRISNLKIDEKLDQLATEIAEIRVATKKRPNGMYHFVGHMRKAFEAMPLAIAEQQAMSAGSPPDGLARALMLARVPHESAVKLAAAQYCDCLTDQAFYERLSQSLPEGQGRDLCTRGKRQVEHCRKNLSELGVEIRLVATNSEFDPTYHQIVQQIPVSSASKAGSVAYMETPAFVYRDEFGQEQVIPAKVSVHVLQDASQDEPKGAPKTNGNGRAKAEAVPNAG